jgi:hypothetical protein
MADMIPSAAPIIVTALLAEADLVYFDGLRRAHFPPERNQLSAHLTMFHHLPPSLAGELATRLRSATRGVPPPAAQVAGLLNLGGGVAYRIDSPGLGEIRRDLAEAFAGMLTPQDAGGWRAHITVQNKVSASAARETLAALTAGFVPRPLRLAGLASYYYRGGPWEPIGRYRFG